MVVLTRAVPLRAVRTAAPLVVQDLASDPVLGMAVTDEDRMKLLKEAEYKERLAVDVDRSGGWQGDLLRAAAAELRREAA
jgi:hypothetical protein